jgi:Flp pilus assembly protein TadG
MHATSRSSHRHRPCRRGMAAAELAILLSVLAFILLASTDFARLFYDYVTITNCASNGAIYGCQDPTFANDTAGIKAAAVLDGAALNPALSTSDVSTMPGTDANGDPFIAVTVTHTFTTLIAYPGIPHTMSLSRTVQMRVCPDTPG